MQRADLCLRLMLLVALMTVAAHTTCAAPPVTATPGMGLASLPPRDLTGYIVVRDSQRPLPSVATGHPYAIADLDGNSEPEVLQGAGKSLKWFGPKHQLVSEVPALASPVSSLAVSDLQGDGMPEIIVGTSETGAVYVYGTSDGLLKRNSQTPHIWVSTNFALALSVTGDSKKELFCITETGLGYLYRQTSQGWFQLWRGSLLPTAPKLAVCGDVNGDGSDEVVCATAEGKVIVFQHQSAGFPGFRISSEVALDSPIESLAVADIDGDRGADILAVTRQRTLSVLSSDGAEVGVRSRYLLGDLQGPVLLAADVDADGLTELIIGGKGRQLGLYRWEDSSLRSLGKTTWSSDVVSSWWLPPAGLVLVDSSGALSVVRLVRSDYVRVMLRGQECRLASPPVLRDGRVYISARDATSLFGLGVAWDANRKLTVLTLGSVSFGLQSDSLEYYVGPQKALDRLEAAPIVSAGKVFVPLKVLKRLFGVQAEWMPETRTLAIGGMDQ